MPTLDQQSKERVESLVYGPEARDKFWSKSREDQIGILKTTAPSVFGGLSPHDYGVFLDSAQKEFAGMKTGAATAAAAAPAAGPNPAAVQPESHWYNPATWGSGTNKSAAEPPPPPVTAAPGPAPTGVLGDRTPQAQQPKPAQPGTAAAPPLFMNPNTAKPKGLITPGNIDLKSLPAVGLPGGFWGTVRSASFGSDGKEVLIPTIVNGKQVSGEEAVAEYRKTGRHLGIFDTPANADPYAQQLHEDWYMGKIPGVQMGPSGSVPRLERRQPLADIGTRAKGGEGLLSAYQHGKAGAAAGFESLVANVASAIAANPVMDRFSGQAAFIARELENRNMEHLVNASAAGLIPRSFGEKAIETVLPAVPKALEYTAAAMAGGAPAMGALAGVEDLDKGLGPAAKSAAVTYLGGKGMQVAGGALSGFVGTKVPYGWMVPPRLTQAAAGAVPSYALTYAQTRDPWRAGVQGAIGGLVGAALPPGRPGSFKEYMAAARAKAAEAVGETARAAARPVATAAIKAKLGIFQDKVRNPNLSAAEHTAAQAEVDRIKQTLVDRWGGSQRPLDLQPAPEPEAARAAPQAGAAAGEEAVVRTPGLTRGGLPPKQLPLNLPQSQAAIPAQTGSGSGPVPPPAADPRPPAAPAAAAPAARPDRAATQPLFPDKLQPSTAPPDGMSEWYKVGGSLARWDAASGGYRFVDPTFGGRASEGQQLDTRPFSPHEVRESANLLAHQRWKPVTAAEAAAPPTPTPPGWHEHVDKPTMPPDPVPGVPRAALKDKNGRVYVWMDKAGQSGEPGYGDPGGKVFTEQQASSAVASGELTHTTPAQPPAGMAEAYHDPRLGTVFRWDANANSYMAKWPDGRTLPSSEHTIRREARGARLLPVPPVTGIGQTVPLPPAKVYRASQPATPGSTAFVSPNTEEWLTMERAQANLNSEGQRGLFTTLTDLVNRIGGGGFVRNTIGSWETGVENSLMARLTGGGLEEGRYVAAKAGHQGGQKKVIVFAAQEEGGTDGLWTFDIGPEETPEDLRGNLLRMGLEHHTLEPHEGGTRVHVFDPGSQLEDIIERVEGHYGTEASYARGTGEFIGGETAAEGRAEFERVIGEYEARHPSPGPDEGVSGAGQGAPDSGRSAPGSEEVAPPAAPEAPPSEPAPPAESPAEPAAEPVHAPTRAAIGKIVEGMNDIETGDLRHDRGNPYESVVITNRDGKSVTVDLADVSPEALDRAARELGESKGMLNYTWHTEAGPVALKGSRAVEALPKPAAMDARTAAIIEKAKQPGMLESTRTLGESSYGPGTGFVFRGEHPDRPGKYEIFPKDPKPGDQPVTVSLQDLEAMLPEPVADVAASRKRLKKLSEDLIHGESGEEEADPRLWDAASLQRFGQDVVTVARGLMQDFEYSNQGFRGQNFQAWAKSLQDELGARIRQAELPGLWNALHPESGNFYSRLERAIEQKMQDKARLSPDQIRQLAKSGAVKDEEIRYVLDAALKNLPPDKITKQALLQEVRSHQITLVSVNPKPKWEHPQLVTPGPYRNYTEHLLQFPHNKPFKGTFESQVHWPGYPDVVVHARTTDRVSIDGKKMLHGEEFQADPHQQARKEVPKSPDSRRVAPHAGEPYGYRTPEMENELRTTEGRFADVTRRMSERGIDPAEKAELFKERDQLADKLSYLKATVPDMPWKKTSEWSGLIMQKMLAAAAHGNYERLSWTTGEQQNVRNEKSGVDFTSYYDRQLVGFMKSYVKKWGAEVKRTSIQTGQEWNEAAKDYAPSWEEVWSVDITPQMRADLLAKGQSLLSLALLLGGGAAAGAAGAMKKKKDREAALASQ